MIWLEVTNAGDLFRGPRHLVEASG
jgi:hypothetical protein